MSTSGSERHWRTCAAVCLLNCNSVADWLRSPRALELLLAVVAEQIAADDVDIAVRIKSARTSERTLEFADSPAGSSRGSTHTYAASMVRFAIEAG
jgi:hypothetical protein